MPRLNNFAFAICSMLYVALPGLCRAQAGAPSAMPFMLQGTEVIATPAPRLGREYEVYVSLPRDYEKTTKRYPVLYVTDANYAFPLIRSIATRVDDHGVGLQDFILIGLSYAKGEKGSDSRNRDYTPSDVNAKNTRDRAQRTGTYGQAHAYLDFITHSVFPMVERRYRIDASKRIYVGHSYGALLGLHALFTHPTLFTHYILGSPSLWYDRHHAFEMERRFAAQQTELPAKVRFFIGGYETVRPGISRYNTNKDMVADLKRFTSQLQSRRYKKLDLQSTVLPDEDHATVFPPLITRGLMWALPANR
jgi:predicted alpha/beta superfamily hydrolase